MLVCTAKYDGISILKDEWTLETWSRGDGIEGETVTEHYKKLNDKSNKIKLFTIGEMIIPKPVFASHTFHRDNGEPFKNARNMIAGLKNSDTISNDLQYAKHVRYGFADEDFMMNKSEQLDFITTHLALVPYRVFRADALKIEELNDLFVEWGKEYDIDGLVLDIDDKNIRKQLGRERNNNPAYSRAFKNPEWSENADTEIVDIEWNISKQGYLKPVGILTPIELEGVTVSRVTLNNAKFAKDNGLGVGSQVVIKRSGMVIPKIVKVLKSTGFKMPEIKDSVVFWNDNGVELCVSNTNEQEIKKIISFFEILKTDNVSEGIVKQLYNAGYTTIKQILNLSISDFEKLDKFGKRKAEIVYNAIKKATTDVDLAKLMHSSNLFVNLGSKKLELLVHFTSKPSYKDILAIKGFSDISAKNFLDGYDKFYDFIKDLPITIKSKKQEQQPKNNNSNMKKGSLEGMSVLFTGVRRQDLVDEIEARGGKNLSAISKNVTHLICKDKNSSSSKMVKAKELGIQIMSVEELEMFLNK
jgi:DNA ligase (NAD+)